MKPDSSMYTSCLIEGDEYVKYSKSDALFIVQKRTVHTHADRRAAVYTSIRNPIITPQPVAFQDDIFYSNWLLSKHSIIEAMPSRRNFKVWVIFESNWVTCVGGKINDIRVNLCLYNNIIIITTLISNGVWTCYFNAISPGSYSNTKFMQTFRLKFLAHWMIYDKRTGIAPSLCSVWAPNDFLLPAQWVCFLHWGNFPSEPCGENYRPAAVHCDQLGEFAKTLNFISYFSLDYEFFYHPEL